jgi:polysaccharide export outer membrane protein
MGETSKIWLAVISMSLAIASLCALPARSAPSAAADAQSEAKHDQDYVLGPGDVIEAQVLGRTDFTTRARIGQDGTIQLPYLGTLPAGDRTPQILGNQIAKALEAGGYYAKPIVTVDIVSYASRYVTVLGEVGTPGLTPIDRPYHLSEILARDGGVREDAADYLVIRGESSPEKRYSIRALATGEGSQDPLVSPGDKVFVPKAEVFYISGQVKSPGAYPLESDMTLRMAIARGGGLTDLGTDHGVKVTSKGGGKRSVDLNGTIDAGDVIVVGERLF